MGGDRGSGAGEPEVENFCSPFFDICITNHATPYQILSILSDGTEQPFGNKYVSL